MKPIPEEFDIEKQLKAFRIAPPPPGLRERILQPARREWTQQTISHPAWTTMKTQLIALAASLLVLMGGTWINNRILVPEAAPAERFAGRSSREVFEIAGLPTHGLFVSARLSASPIDSLSHLQSRREEMMDLLDDPPLPRALSSPNGQTLKFRQKMRLEASYC